jgi:hypothetical protein
MDKLKTTQESLDAVNKAISDQIELGLDGQKFNTLQKSYTTALGLVGYNLEKPANQLVVFGAPIRKTIPRKIEPTGSVVHWKVITSVTPAGPLSAIEGERGSAVTTVLEDKFVGMKSFGLQDSVTLEAITAGRNFQDAKATAHTNLLLRLMTQEEIQLIFSNGSTALTRPGTPTATGSDSGGTIAGASYNVYVAALTGVAANRVVLNTQKANLVLGVSAYDSAYAPISGAFDGVTNKCASAGTATITGGETDGSIACSVTPVEGAMAYAWFVGTSGNEVLQEVTTNSAVTFTALVAGGTAASALTADGSADVNSYDGIFPQVIAGNGYYNDLGYTSFHSNDAGVQEIDDYCAWLYQNWKIGPAKIWCGYGAFADITKAIVSSTAAPTYLIANDVQDRANFIGSLRTAKYINKYTGEVIDLEVHPWFPSSTIACFVDTVPYENANIPHVLEMGLGYDYTAIEYAQTKPKYEFETRFFGALKHYFPASFGIITNIKPGLA